MGVIKNLRKKIVTVKEPEPEPQKAPRLNSTGRPSDLRMGFTTAERAEVIGGGDGVSPGLGSRQTSANSNSFRTCSSWTEEGVPNKVYLHSKTAKRSIMHVEPYFQPLLNAAGIALGAMYLLIVTSGQFPTARSTLVTTLNSVLTDESQVVDKMVQEASSESVLGGGSSASDGNSPSDLVPHTPTSAFWQFFSVWCLLQLLCVAINLVDQMRFYDWWIRSKMADNNRRGFSTWGYPLFGFIPVPALPPVALRLVSFAYMCALLFASQRPGQKTAALCFVLAFLYHGQLWAERSSSYHREILTLTVLIYAMLCTGGKEGGALTLWMLRVHLGSIYSISVVQKIFTSIIRGKAWWSYSPHYFMWTAMWAKPFYPKMQKRLFLRPWLMSLLGFGALIIEAAPAIIPFLDGKKPETAVLTVLSYSALVSFHVGVFFLQGIDYISFFAPALLSGFVFGGHLNADDAWETIQAEVSSALFSTARGDLSSGGVGIGSSGLTGELICQCLALLFLAAQLLSVITTAENWNVNCPPLMSSPMFVTVVKLDDNNAPVNYLMSDEKHSSLKFERLQWLSPFIKSEYSMGLEEEDIKRIPFPFASFGWKTANLDAIPKVVHHFFKEDVKPGFFLYTNVELTDSLVDKLESLMYDLHGDVVPERWRGVWPNRTKEKDRYKAYENLPEVYSRFKDIQDEFEEIVTSYATRDSLMEPTWSE